MANGFAPFLLRHIRSITQESTPQDKLEPIGYLNMLQSQRGIANVKLNDGNTGHRREVRFTYKQRLTSVHVDDAKSCTDTNVIPRLEATLPLDIVKQIAVHIEDEVVAQYEAQASQTVMVGQPATPLMRELLDDVFAAANAILEGVNEDLLTAQVAAFGANRANNGLTTAKTININADATKNNLTDGITELLSDYKVNGGKGRPQVVGSGLMYNWIVQQFAKTSGDQAGLDSRIFAGAMDFYHDLSADTILGSNEVAVLEPNAVQLIEYMEYTGFKAGVKPGGSTFFTMALPSLVGGSIVPVMFDVQLKYNDCPETLTEAYGGGSLAVEKGWNLIVSKQCALFTIPTDAFRATDKLNGNRGSYRYAITNTCDTC